MSKKITLFILLTILITSKCYSQDENKIILKVTGKIKIKNNKNDYFFTKKDFLSLSQKTINTETFWTPKYNFSGPEITTILNRVGAQGKTLKACAINGYCYSIEISNIEKYKPILAIKQNNDFLKPYEFGPLFIVYPLSTYKKELSAPTERSKFVWQVNSLEIK